MTRKQVLLTIRQVDTLKDKAKNTGISFSEMLRRVLDEALFGINGADNE